MCILFLLSPVYKLKKGEKWQWSQTESMYWQENSSELLIGFWRVFVTNVRYVPSRTNDRILLSEGLCGGIAHGVPLGLPIQESTDGNLFPDYTNRHRLIKSIYGRFGKGINIGLFIWNLAGTYPFISGVPDNQRVYDFRILSTSVSICLTDDTVKIMNTNNRQQSREVTGIRTSIPIKSAINPSSSAFIWARAPFSINSDMTRPRSSLGTMRWTIDVEVILAQVQAAPFIR